nr:probable isoprenylcysteine alpha-carbonyl methylesterase ICMEL1 isoform X6 [Ipomoea batatas]GMD57380.1 probable isoprenylcysteine alpha-carbonyl methylesterase ICMEL1 isoform X6 [Ipomoea batatas]
MPPWGVRMLFLRSRDGGEFPVTRRFLPAPVAAAAPLSVRMSEGLLLKPIWSQGWPLSCCGISVGYYYFFSRQVRRSIVYGWTFTCLKTMMAPSQL